MRISAARHDPDAAIGERFCKYPGICLDLVGVDFEIISQCLTQADRLCRKDVAVK